MIEKKADRRIEYGKNKLNDKTMEKVAGGFPDGEFPAGYMCCPRCGCNKDNLELKYETTGSQPDSAIPQLRETLTYRLYHCPDCGFEFWGYDVFFSKA